MRQIITEKHKDTIAVAIRPETEMICFEGTVRSSKTVDAISCFYFAVRNSPDYLHCIGARDYDAIRDNVLECNGLGLQKKYPGVKLVKDRIGGYFLTMKGKDRKTKKILLAGYSNKTHWTKILGKTIGVFLIDEVNIADKQFVDECFARQTSADKPLMIWTLNGDTPDHFVYMEYINYCKPLGIVPPTILEDMNKLENKRGWYYWHWTMRDNPIMTDEKIERAMRLYPVGSHYYNTKILGIRGAPEGAIFAQYLNDSFVCKTEPVNIRGQTIKLSEMDLLKFNGQYISYTFGIDLGNNDVKRGTILTFMGITRGYEYIDVLSTYQCKSTEANALAEEITEKIREWHEGIPNLDRVDSIRIDGYGAIQVIVPTIRKRLIAKGVDTLCDMAIKFGEQGGLKVRLDLMLLLVGQKRIRFNSNQGGLACFNNLKKLRYDPKTGLPLDKNELPMDYYDSLGYTLTPHTHMLTEVLKGGRKNEN